MFNLNETSDQVAVAVNGELTIPNAEVIKAGLLESLAHGKDVVMDLANVSELDSAGTQLLFYAKRMAQARQQGFHLVNHSPAVVEVFELYRLAPIFGDPMVLAAHSMGTGASAGKGAGS